MRFPHGTVRGYNRGCKCPDCMEARLAYDRKRRGVKKPAPRGVPTAFDAAKLSRILEREGIPMDDFSRDLGFDMRTVSHAISRGSCGLYTLDRIACGLGMHYSEFAKEVL